MDERILKFIRRHHVMTIATAGSSGPWCANIFYSYIPGDNIFVFTSSDGTRHGAEMKENSFIAASIVLETKNVGLVQGLQLQGYVTKPEGQAAKRARNSYLKRFPYAVVADLELWILHPTVMKLTDNRLGFGKKLYWQNQEGPGDE